MGGDSTHFINANTWEYLNETSESAIVRTFCQNSFIPQQLSNVVETGPTVETLTPYSQYECCVREDDGAVSSEWFLYQSSVH